MLKKSYKIAVLFCLITVFTSPDAQSLDRLEFNSNRVIDSEPGLITLPVVDPSKPAEEEEETPQDLYRWIGLVPESTTRFLANCLTPLGSEVMGNNLFRQMPSNSILRRFCLYQSNSTNVFPADNMSHVTDLGTDAIEPELLNSALFESARTAFQRFADEEKYAAAFGAGNPVPFASNPPLPLVSIIGDGPMVDIGYQVAQNFVCNGTECVADIVRHELDSDRLGELARAIADQVRSWKANEAERPILTIAILSSLIDTTFDGFYSTIDSMEGPEQSVGRAIEYAACEGAFVTATVYRSVLEPMITAPFALHDRPSQQYCHDTYGTALSETSLDQTKSKMKEDSRRQLMFYPIIKNTEKDLVKLSFSLLADRGTDVANLQGSTVGLAAAMAGVFYYEPTTTILDAMGYFTRAPGLICQSSPKPGICTWPGANPCGVCWPGDAPGPNPIGYFNSGPSFNTNPAGPSWPTETLP